MGEQLKAVTSAVAALLTLPVIAGSAYIYDCVRFSTKPNECDAQWLAGLSMMGVSVGTGMAARMGYQRGYNTYNPNLSRPVTPKELVVDENGEPVYRRNSAGRLIDQQGHFVAEGRSTDER